MPLDALRLFDTTLRDGAEAPGFSPTPDQRRAIGRALVAAGIDVIELANSDVEDVDGIVALASELGDVETCVIAPATSDAVAKSLVLLEGSRRPRIHLYGEVARPGALAPALEALFAARVNVDRVEFSPMRAFELSRDEVGEIAVAVGDSGASMLNLSDTRGDATPDRVRDLVGHLGARLGESCPISFHGHDHAGRAVANAIAACEAGALQVHVCVRGVGPRGGNTSLERFVEAFDASGSGATARLHVDRTALPGLVDLVSRATT